MTSTDNPGARPRVLIVDDDAMMRLLTRQTLGRAGFDTDEADSGEAALARFAAAHPDIVLLDVMMPGIDGYQVCRQLRALPAGRSVPILMLTGLDDTESIDRAYRIGATDFISKPINWSILGHRVRYLLRASLAFNELERNQTRLANAQRIAQLGSWEWNAGRSEMQWSEETFRVLGYDAASTVPSPEALIARVHPGQRADVEQSLRSMLESGQELQPDATLLLPDGVEHHVRLQAEAVLDANGRLTTVIGTIQDVTQIKQAEEKIRQLVYHDALTGLPNRQLFMERLAHGLARARRHDYSLAVVSLDLDQFKRINDTLGHGHGNELLVAVSRRLGEVLRESDTMSREERGGEEAFARLGGDEFCVLIGELNQPHDAAKVARRLLDILRRPFTLASGQEVVVSASIGLALYPIDGTDAETLLRNAGAAMHFAKDQGRDNYQFYSERMNATALEKLGLEAQLRKGVERGEFLLHFQPKLHTASATVVGLEALIRWQHPELGMVPPSQFIPLAEETGLIIPIGEWVLRTACRAACAWQGSGGEAVHVAVNISSPHFRHPALVATVSSALSLSGLDPALLEIEVTESMLMQQHESTLDTLRQLKGMGLRLTIDDFGTGYSSLSYLKRFPIHALKIDRSFVQGLPADSDDVAITRAIIALAHSLKLEVVAEGVETQDQLAFLRQHGCDQVQGYLFSRPVSAERIPSLLASRRPQSVAAG